MIKYCLIFVIAIFIFGKNHAQGIYDVAKIADEFKKDAAVVVRNEEQFFDVKTLGTAHYDYKIALTILNKADDDYSKMAESYDKFSTIYNIKATLYDAAGKK